MNIITRLFRKIEVAHADAVLRREHLKRLADDVALRRRFIGEPYEKRRAAQLRVTRG